MERLTRRINGVVVYVGTKNPYTTGQIPCEVEPAGVREMMDRLAMYEDAKEAGRLVVIPRWKNEEERTERLRLMRIMADGAIDRLMENPLKEEIGKINEAVVKRAGASSGPSMKATKIAAELRKTPSRSKRKLLDKAAEMLDALMQENDALRRMLEGDGRPNVKVLHTMNADRLLELAKADEDGGLFLLPLEPGRSMLCQEYFERPWVMKNVTLCVQYQSSTGIIFYMGYDVFRDLVERGRITPLSPEGEKTLEGKVNV